MPPTIPPQLGTLRSGLQGCAHRMPETGRAACADRPATRRLLHERGLRLRQPRVCSGTDDSKAFPHLSKVAYNRMTYNRTPASKKGSDPSVRGSPC